MEGFKSNQKMKSDIACYKEGGAVYKSRHSEKTEEAKDIAQDKQIVKKAFKMHDTQSHEGEKTDLTKLKKGGRMKKCGGGNVRKYKAGGSVTGGSDVAKDGGKKTGGADIKTGQKTGGSDAKKDGGKKTGGSDAAKDGGAKSMGLNNAFKKGGAAKKYADGGIVDKLKAVGKRAYENVMGTPEQNKAAAEQEKRIAEQDPSSYEAKYRKLMGKKEGGSLKAVDAEENPGLAKLPTNVRNKMGYAKTGGKVKKYADGGPISQTSQEIIQGKRPAQSTPGTMTPEERRASIAKAFGAKK